MIKAIVAVDEKWGIGKKNDLLFRLPLDMKYFREKTLGKTVCMGYNTLLSFPEGKPLKNRKNIIEKSLKSKFAPEFLNRLNDVIYFNDLTDDNLKDIIKLEINKLIGRLHKINFDGKYGDKTIDFIYEVIKQQKEYGARPIARAIQDNVENKITDLLLDNDYEKKYIFDFDKIIN